MRQTSGSQPAGKPPITTGCCPFRSNRVPRLLLVLSTGLRAEEAEFPSCTYVGVERLGRGGQVHRGVTPATCQYPNPAAGFRRRALFFESSPDANQSVNELSGHLSIAAWTPQRAVQVSTSPKPWEQTNEGNRAYGISCRTRPIRWEVEGSRNEQVSHGPG